MSLFDAFSYKGKRAVVVGGATGMGAATAELVRDAGAEVVVLDRAEVTLDGVKTLQVNMADKASIEAATDECGGPVDALFSCAGVADGTPGIEKINFLGHRHMINLHDRRAARCARFGHRHDLVRRRLRLGAEPRERQRSTSTSQTSTRRRSGPSTTTTPTTCGRKLTINAYVVARGDGLHEEGHPHQRDPAGADQHSAGPANADLWLTFGQDYRDETRPRSLDSARPGLPAGLPVQRRGLGDHRHHAGDRHRLLRVGVAGVVRGRGGAVEFMRSVF